MDNRKLIISILLMFCMTGCFKNQNKDTGNNTSKDPFYFECGGWDWERFPLIKPYEIITFDKGDDWNLQPAKEAKKIEETHQPRNINKISYLNDVFFIYSNNGTIVNAQKVFEAWYIVLPKDSLIFGFTNELDFRREMKNYIDVNNIDDIEWVNPDDYFNMFKETYCLPWIKDCESNVSD